MSKRAYVNDVQKNVMVDFFIANPKIISNSFSESFTYNDGERLWDELCALLNASGPAQKDVKKWKKTWDDIKRCVKEKVSTINREKNVTGNKALTTGPLSVIEEKFASVIGEVLILGDPHIEDTGFGNPIPCVETFTTTPSPSVSFNLNCEENLLLDSLIANKTLNENNIFKTMTDNKTKQSTSNKRKFEPATDEVIKHQKALADATKFQGMQLQRIAIAMENRNNIEQQRNEILMAHYGISTENKEETALNISADLI